MDTLSDRIRQIIDYHGLSIRAFEQKIECKEGIIQKFLQRNTDLNTKNITNIALFFPNLSTEWLLTGEGNMLKSDEKGVIQTNKGGKNNTNIASGTFLKSGNNITSKSNNSINTDEKKELLDVECAICKEKDKLIASLEKQIKLLERIANINND